MKKTILNKYVFLIVLISVIFISCDEEDYTAPAPPAPTALEAGSADFSNYVAIGNSLTAGYTDGALFIAAQDNAMPNLLANKFALTGGGSFTTPYMNDNIGGALLGGNLALEPRLYFNGAGPVRLDAMPTTEISSVIPGPYNNMGVPGAKSFHLLANGYGNIAGVALGLANPYFARMASTPNASVMEDVLAQSPTFFTLWIGGNDVLSYALSGGTGTNQLGNYDPATYGGSDITDPNVFTGVFGSIVTAITTNDAKGVLVNVPYVSTLPYFTTIPYNAVPLDAATATQLNAGFAPYNGTLDYLVSVSLITQEEADARKVVYAAGQNAVLIMDETLTDLTGIDPALVSMRPATAEDLIVLPASSFIGTLADPNNPATVNGVAVPLSDQWVLLPSEQMEIEIATDAFNATIEQVATQHDLAFVDANALMQDLSIGGLPFDEFTMTNSLVFGNTFSLDGVHTTARGNAFMANKVLMAIDAKYGTNFEASGNLNKATDFNTNYPESL